MRLGDSFSDWEQIPKRPLIVPETDMSSFMKPPLIEVNFNTEHFDHLFFNENNRLEKNDEQTRTSPPCWRHVRVQHGRHAYLTDKPGAMFTVILGKGQTNAMSSISFNDISGVKIEVLKSYENFGILHYALRCILPASASVINVTEGIIDCTWSTRVSELASAVIYDSAQVSTDILNIFRGAAAPAVCYAVFDVLSEKQVQIFKILQY
jgi:hypothetical protein